MPWHVLPHSDEHELTPWHLQFGWPLKNKFFALDVEELTATNQSVWTTAGVFFLKSPLIAKWLEHWTCNLKATSSSPTLTTNWISSQYFILSSNPQPPLCKIKANWFVSSQLEFLTLLCLFKLFVSVVCLTPLALDLPQVDITSFTFTADSKQGELLRLWSSQASNKVVRGRLTTLSPRALKSKSDWSKHSDLFLGH